MWSPKLKLEASDAFATASMLRITKITQFSVIIGKSIEKY